MADILNNIGVEQSLRPQTIQSAALNSGNVDTQGAGSVAVVVLVGDIADTLTASNKIDLRIEHADDNGSGAPGTYAACVDDDVLNFSGLSSGLFMSIDAAAKEQKRHVIGYRGTRRFVRVTATPTGLTTGGPIAMLAIKGFTSIKPLANT